MNDQIKSLLQSFESNSMKLMSNLINIISYERQLKNDVQNALKELMNENIKKEFENLREENDGLKKLYLSSYEENKKNLKDVQESRVQYRLILNKLKEKEKKIEELERIKFNLMRRINTHPSLPYIFFKKKMFHCMAQNHQCVCHICEAKISNFTDANREANSDRFIAEGNLEKPHDIVTIMDITRENQTDSFPSQETKNSSLISELLMENDSLKTQLLIQNEKLENLKFQNLTEEKIINSKFYKKILKDVDEYMNILLKLKDSNQDLIIKNQSLLKEKENEIKIVETNFNAKIKEYVDSLLLEKILNETNQKKIDNLSLEIKSLEEELKIAKSNDPRTMLENFQKEKENYVKRIETLNNKLREYENKYLKECEKNHAFEANSDALALKVDLDRTLQKKIDNISKLEAELKLEREYNEKNIEELEVNEKGLMDLNKKVKALTSHLKDAEEKIAKMTNEHTKSTEVIKRFQEEREITKSQVKLFEEKLQLEFEIRFKFEQEIKNLKTYLNSCEEYIKLKEEELSKIKNEHELHVNEIEKYKENDSILSKFIEGSKQSLAKAALELDLLKSKYESVCKIKNIDNKGNNQQSYADLRTSFEELEATLYIYKVKYNKF
jgi:hypothetical protein